MVWKRHPKYRKYEISNNGLVRRIGKTEPLKIRYDKGSKPTVILRVNKRNTQKRVGQLVLETFKGRNIYDHTEFRYLDGDVTNNSIENLAWERLEFKGSRPVMQIDQDGNVIRIWDSFFDARDNGGFNVASIKYCCEGKFNLHKDFYWEYKTVNQTKITRSKKVIIMRNANDKFKFDDVKSAYEHCLINELTTSEFNSFASSVSSVTNTKKTYLGHRWRTKKVNFEIRLNFDNILEYI